MILPMLAACMVHPTLMSNGYSINPSLIPQQNFVRLDPNCYVLGDYSICYFEGVNSYSMVYNSTFSMLPTLGPSSYVLTYPWSQAENISTLLGKIIIFNANGTVYDNKTEFNIIHRCIEIKNNSCITKGDNNNYSDGLIPRQNIKAVVEWNIAYVGG